MESLQLPKDLFWTGKMEPISPEHQLFALNSSEEEWTLEDYLKLNNEIEIEPSSQQINESGTKEFLLEYEFDDIKSDEDSSSVKSENWTESFTVPSEEVLMIQQQPEDSSVFYYQSIDSKQNFEVDVAPGTYFNQSELIQLTPPQTPPQHKEEYVIHNLISQQEHQEQQVSPINNYLANQLYVVTEIPNLSPVTSECIEYSSDVSNSPISEDVAREMKIVDDILRVRAKDLPDWNDEDDNCSTDSSNLAQSFLDDDSNWSPTSPSLDSSVGSPSAGGKCLSSSAFGNKKRSRPYGRGPEERKSRKKEQNKNAATRYRLKKKEEMKVILDEESILAERHEELAKTVNEFESEIKYLKNLIREFYKKK